MGERQDRRKERVKINALIHNLEEVIRTCVDQETLGEKFRKEIGAKGPIGPLIADYLADRVDHVLELVQEVMEPHSQDDYAYQRFERLIEASKTIGTLTSTGLSTEEMNDLDPLLDKQQYHLWTPLKEFEGVLAEELKAMRATLWPEKSTASTTTPLQTRTEFEEKVQWNGSVQLLGRLFDELARKGYIVRPQTHGTNSTTRLCKMILDLFEVYTKNGTPTVDSLRKAMVNPGKATEKFSLAPITNFERANPHLPPE